MKNKIENLKQTLVKLAPQGIALAFSGGVDSTLLLNMLSLIRTENPFPLHALTIHSLFHKEEEKQETISITSALDIPHYFFEANPLSNPKIRLNPLNRCYHCKKSMFSLLFKHAANHGLKTLLDGTNADDLKVYRPGKKALNELGVLSPLAQCGLSKKEIRDYAAELNLSCSSKPAAPCLATRFEYGVELKPDLIEMVKKGEKALREIFPDTSFRLRYHNKIARIEVPSASLSLAVSKRESIIQKLKELGFNYITLDLEGFRSGSMDIHLDSKNNAV
jgi:uncharacterized protein